MTSGRPIDHIVLAVSGLAFLFAKTRRRMPSGSRSINRSKWRVWHTRIHIRATEPEKAANFVGQLFDGRVENHGDRFNVQCGATLKIVVTSQRVGRLSANSCHTTLDPKRLLRAESESCRGV